MATQTKFPQPKLGTFTTPTFSGRSLIFHPSSPLFFTGWISPANTGWILVTSADDQTLVLYSPFIKARNTPYKRVKASNNYKTFPKYINNNPVLPDTFKKKRREHTSDLIRDKPHGSFWVLSVNIYQHSRYIPCDLKEAPHKIRWLFLWHVLVSISQPCSCSWERVWLYSFMNE